MRQTINLQTLIINYCRRSGIFNFNFEEIVLLLLNLSIF